MKDNINSSVSKISQIHSLVAGFLTSRLKEEGFDEFSSSHGNILFQLNLKPKMLMGELSQRINRDKSTTTVLVRKLRLLGFIQEQQDPKDKRNKIISLTQKGTQFNEVTKTISKELLAKFFNGFTQEEKEQFVMFQDRIAKNFL